MKCANEIAMKLFVQIKNGSILNLSPELVESTNFFIVFFISIPKGKGNSKPQKLQTI